MEEEKMIDAVKKYWNDRPCNIKHSNKLIGSKEYFDEVEHRKYFVEPHIPKFADFSKWKNKKVLEIGCGIGTDTINFARAGAKVTAIDLSGESMQIAKQRAELFNLDINFIEGNAEELEKYVKIETYDLIYSFGVIHHSPCPEAIIDKIKYYMDEHTELRIMLYSKYSWKSLRILLHLDQPEAQSGCPIAKTFSYNNIKDLLGDVRFCSVSKEHIFPYRISDYKEYKYNKVWYFKIMPIKLFKFLEKHLGWHTLIIAKI